METRQIPCGECGQIDIALQTPGQYGPGSTVNITFDVRTAVSALAPTYDEKQGAEVNASDENRLTPLHTAVQEGHAEMVKLLVKEDHPESVLVHQATLKGPMLQ